MPQFVFDSLLECAYRETREGISRDLLIVKFISVYALSKNMKEESSGRGDEAGNKMRVRGCKCKQVGGKERSQLFALLCAAVESRSKFITR